MQKLPFDKVFTNASSSTINKYTEPLSRLMEEYDINTPLRKAHFLSQLAQESGELRYTEENLNYSYTRLLQVFPKYFRSPAQARAVAYNPEKIANIVYANRIGNGDNKSGDGYLFRGRGLIQLTGRNNYQAFLDHLLQLSPSVIDSATDAAIHDQSDPLAHLAPLLSNPELAVRSACYFWQSNGLNELADRGEKDINVEQVTRRVNGGKNGLSSRIVYFYRALVALRNI